MFEIRKTIIACLLLLVAISACGPSKSELLLQKRQQYLTSHTDIDPSIKDAIQGGEILVGMTADEVYVTRGLPGVIQTSVGKGGVYTNTWQYRDCTVYLGIDKKVSKIVYGQ